ncbi:substrate-binding domain-containing protein [Carnimonas nigrificans]|uniref:substrate-binding domain-containing protein n=1 Tax=Carnimonas nigrificans TaxID=64323 RepID=UPI0004710399|nr:substrate-binding domain-containing protein [Carnimonas nigrificans]
MKERLAALVVLTCIFSAPSSWAAEQTLEVWVSGGLMPVIQEIAPTYEHAKGVHLDIKAAPSMGVTPQSVPERFAHHEKVDVLVMVDAGIDPLIKQGWVDTESRTPLAESYIGMAVPAGQPIPDISTPDKLKRVLLKARHVVYSDSASGRYISGTLFKKLGIESEMKGKAEQIQATPVGSIVAQGKADIGFQQLSELNAVPGISIVGLLPKSVQKMTLYSGIESSDSQQKDASSEFIQYLQSKDVARVIETKGMKAVPSYTNLDVK